MSNSFTYKDGIIVSESDKKLYRFLTLDNGLRALLIQDTPGPCDTDETDDDDVKMLSGDESGSSEEESDSGDEDAGSCDEDKSGKDKQPKVKQSAAALAVGIGSFSDPPELQGLAHYLEHMVFMGSEKYPSENDFDAYICERGGSSNAWTDCESTTFYFDVHRKHFADSLDRFAQFFVAPLLQKDSMDREVRAVNSEFEMSYTSDSARLEQLLAGHAKSDHPMGTFTFGNLKSLYEEPKAAGVDVYDYLQNFRVRHYSSDYMALVVQSLDDLDTSEKLVREIFSHVPKNGLPKPTYEKDVFELPFSEDLFCQKLYKVVPVKDVKKLTITWALPSMKPEYKAHPEQLLGHVLGHEGAGSMISLMRKRNLGIELTAGSSEGFASNSTCCLICVEVTLTDNGLENYEEVIEIIFGYLNILRKEGISKRLFDEVQKIERAEWRFNEEKDAIDNVETIAANMHNYSKEHIVCGRNLLFDYNPDLYQSCIDALTVDKANFVLVARKFESECEMTEKWFDVKYTSQDLDNSSLERWRSKDLSSELHLPKENPFVATQFDIKPPEAATHHQYPIRIELPLELSQFGELYYKNDDKFLLPKGIVKIQLHSPLFSATQRCAKNAVLLELMVYALKQDLCEDTYDAEQASLDFSIKGTWQGLKISLDGYNETLFSLYVIILKHLQQFTLDEGHFVAVKERQRQVYYNECFKPSSFNKSICWYFLSDACWLANDKLAVLEEISAADLLAFRDDFLKELRLMCYVHGNFLQKEALKFFEITVTQLKFKASEDFVDARCAVLPKGDRRIRLMNMNLEDVNSTLVNYYQAGPSTVRARVVSELLTSIMDEPCMDFLRTKHQLGYSVYTSRVLSEGVNGIRVGVSSQADRHSADKVHKLMEQFLQLMERHLLDMSEEQFGNFVASLVELKRVEDNCMSDEVYRNWDELEYRECLFNRIQLEIQELDSITRDEVMQCLKETCLHPERKKLSIQVSGTKSFKKSKSASNSASESLQVEMQEVEEKVYRMDLNYCASVKKEKVSAEVLWVEDLRKERNSLQYFHVHKITS